MGKSPGNFLEFDFEIRMATLIDFDDLYRFWAQIDLGVQIKWRREDF